VGTNMEVCSVFLVDTPGTCLQSFISENCESAINRLFVRRECERMPFCRNCGKEIAADAKFCSNCGALTSTQQLPPTSPTPSQQPVSQRQVTLSFPPIPSQPPMNILVVLGYVFAILGGLVGMVIGLYLSTRKDPICKKHGELILGLSSLMFVIWISAAWLLT